MRTTTGIALHLISIVFVILALITAYRGRTPDLVESRRRFRTLFVSVAGAYMGFVLLVETFLRGQTAHPIASLLNATAIFAIVFFMAISLLTIKFTLLLEPTRSPSAAPELDAAENALLGRLHEAVAAQKILHEEGLTITRFAEHLGVQEHKLRRLINAKMGFRNFNDFVNFHRVQDACVALADPSWGRLPVLTIAMNLGYRSLGPFNRTFKEITGCTPAEFRQQKLAIEPIATNNIALTLRL